MSALRPWHDAPPCPSCTARVATPASLSGCHGRDNDPRLLWCPACGHDWAEEDFRAVAKAWWSAGAYEGREVALALVEEHRREATRAVDRLERGLIERPHAPGESGGGR